MDFEFLDIHIHLTFAGSSLSRVDVAIYAAQVLVASLSVEFLVRSWKLSDLVKLLPDSPALFKPDLPLLDDKPSTEPSVKLLSPSNCDKFADLLLQVQEGLAEFPPVPCDEGVNGTYFLKNKKGKYIAVFKPEDEEIFSPHNPKSGAEQEDRMKSLVGLLPGEASRREVAAFLVDREGFFGVPKTAMASITHPLFNGTKTGSMQEFVESDGPSWDVGPSAFPVREVHKIGILDLYLFNFDRHGGNILLNEEEGLLIPIDNGFSLPDTVAVPNLWFEWMNWSQAKKPFDEDTRAFIDNLDVNRDLAMLKVKFYMDACSNLNVGRAWHS